MYDVEHIKQDTSLWLFCSSPALCRSCVSSESEKHCLLVNQTASNGIIQKIPTSVLPTYNIQHSCTVYSAQNGFWLYLFRCNQRKIV